MSNVIDKIVDNELAGMDEEFNLLSSLQETVENYMYKACEDVVTDIKFEIERLKTKALLHTDKKTVISFDEVLEILSKYDK